MILRKTSCVLILLLVATRVAPVAAAGDSPPSYEEARKASWMLTSILIKSLEEGDAKQWPGTHAWLQDFHKQTKGIDKDTPVAKWPKVDIGKLVDHNPNFWRMYFEIAPADPALTIIHAGLLLSQGEAKRAAYILALGKHRPGVPKELIQGMQMLQNTAMAALKASDALTEEGTKLFDQGDYDGAIKKYQEAHKLCPTNGWTYYEIAFTKRIKAQIARGEPAPKLGTTVVNAHLHDTPAITSAFAKARRLDPLEPMAYQGADPEVIRGAEAIAKRITPALKALQQQGIAKQDEYHALGDLSVGLNEAGIHDLAIFARQLMASRRNGYDPTDFPFFAAGLRKLAPGAATEEVLARLAGEKSKELLKFRALTQIEQEVGLPAPESGERVYIPSGPAPKVDPNKPVNVDFLRLLTHEDELAKRAKVEDLAKFAKAAGGTAEEFLGRSETPGVVVIQFKCAPSGHTIEIKQQPKGIDEKLLKAMREAIAKLDKASVKEGSVEFQIQFTIKPKNKQPAQEK